MNAKISVVCYKQKILSNGTSPIMLRISKDGKRTLKSLGVSARPEHWDYKKEAPKTKCPNKELILKVILEAKSEWNQKILEKKIKGEEFTSLSLMHEEKTQKNHVCTVEEFYQELIKELREQGKIGNSYAYQSSYYSLKLLNKGKPLHYTFDRIDALFLRKFEDFLAAKGNKETTLHFQFRTLRATYKRAIEAQMASGEKNPFNVFKISKFSTKTQKRALEKDDVLKLLQADCSQKPKIRQFAQDIFTFSYLAGGISFVDIAHLTQEHIEQGRLKYNRHKTGGAINLGLGDQAMVIMDKFVLQRETSGYIFPVLHQAKHKTPMQQNHRIHKKCYQINRELKAMAQELGITARVTTYVARHSFATVLKKSGVQIEVISEALGHQDLKTTAIYLARFDNEQIDRVLDHLL